MDDHGERLARIEAKQDMLLVEFRARVEDQDEHNKNFYETRDKVNALESKFKFIGAIFVPVTSFLGWLFSKKSGQ